MRWGFLLLSCCYVRRVDHCWVYCDGIFGRWNEDERWSFDVHRVIKYGLISGYTTTGLSMFDSQMPDFKLGFWSIGRDQPDANLRERKSGKVRCIEFNLNADPARVGLNVQRALQAWWVKAYTAN